MQPLAECSNVMLWFLVLPLGGIAAACIKTWIERSLRWKRSKQSHPSPSP